MTKESYSFTYLILTLLFVVCLIVSNLLEIKTVDVGPITITAGVIVFPISYIINDCIVEVYGLRKAKLTIWAGFGASLLISALLQLGIFLPGSESWDGQPAMELIFGAVPRMFAASLAAFLCGSMINAYVMSIMKIKSKNGRNFSVRAIVSTIFGEGADSLIFFPIAFAGLLTWREITLLIITQTVIKTLYEVLILPVTMKVVRWIKGIESRNVTLQTIP